MGFAMCGGMKLKHWNILNLPPGSLGSLSVSFCRRDTHVDRSFVRSLALLQKVLQLLEFQSCSKVDANLSRATDMCEMTAHYDYESVNSRDSQTMTNIYIYNIYPPVPILSKKTSWVWYQDKRYTQMEVYPIKCDHKPWGLGWFWGTYPQHPKTISSLLKSQELYSRPTLDTPHFPKASWYVSSLYHIPLYM